MSDIHEAPHTKLMAPELKDALKSAMMAKKLILRNDVGTSGIEAPDPAMIAAYRNVLLSNGEGHFVLKDLLRMLRFTEKGEGIVHLAMHNVGLEILTRCGIEGDDIVSALINGA